MAEQDEVSQGAEAARGSDQESDTETTHSGADVPLNRAQRRALASGKKQGGGLPGSHASPGGAAAMNRGSRPAGQAPRQSRASGRGK